MTSKPVVVEYMHIADCILTYYISLKNKELDVITLIQITCGVHAYYISLKNKELDVITF